MKKTVFPLVCVALFFSGCAGEKGPSVIDLFPENPRVFVSFPYGPGEGTLCRTPVPRPSLVVVSRTIRSLAGDSGSVREVPLQDGAAFGVWSNPARIAAIREYLNQLNRGRRIVLKVKLFRIGKRIPYLVRSFSVLTDRPFLAAAWADGKVTRAVSGFFVSAGQEVVPVLDVTLLSPGFRSCRSVTPGLPGPDIVFGARKAIVKKGSTNLELTWERANERHEGR